MKIDWYLVVEAIEGISLARSCGNNSLHAETSDY